MLKQLLLASVWLGTMSVVAQAAPISTFSSSTTSPIAPSGALVTEISLDGIATSSTATIVTSAYTISFDGVPSGDGVVQGTLSGVHATPVAGVSGGVPTYLTGGFASSTTTDVAQSGNYLSTGGSGASITITFAVPQTSLALLWGSIDPNNEVTLSGGSIVGSDTLLGSSVASSAGFVANGGQGFGGSAYVSLTDAAFTSATFTSDVPSFEFAAIAGSNVPFSVPEPMSLTIFGASLVGLAGARRLFAG